MSHEVEQQHTDNNIGHQAGYYQGSNWSLPYMSPWSRIHTDPELVSVLRHMNCSYLGHPGAPPTLLGLKQHARSLAKLIMLLEPSVSSGEVDGSRLDDGNFGDAKRKLGYGGAFDWLADLGVPYTSDDPNHHRPLNALLNEVKSRHDLMGTYYHCPLTEVPPRPPQEGTKNEYYASNVASMPYASHHNLVMHANECLERLDHEFSATGGILSLIPPDGEGAGEKKEHEEGSDSLAAVKNTLLGQWLIFCQGLMVRTHELQIEHAKLLDVMAGEAVAPAQSLWQGGPDGRRERALVFPQDRWILANAGDDIFNHLHDLFDQREKTYQQVMKEYKKAGTSGEIDWVQNRGGGEYARGIIPLHIMTRYYRLAGKGRSTIFVIPAAEHHPGLEWTRDGDGSGTGVAGPTVISAVQPRWPERVSAWETRFKNKIADATKMGRENWTLRRDKEDGERQLRVLRHEVQRHMRIADAATEMLANVGAHGEPEEQKEALKRELDKQRVDWEAHSAQVRERSRFLADRARAERYQEALHKARDMASETDPTGQLAVYLLKVLSGTEE